MECYRGFPPSLCFWNLGTGGDLAATILSSVMCGDVWVRSSPAGWHLPPLEAALRLLRNCKEKKGYSETVLRTLSLQSPDLRSYEPVLNCLLVGNGDQDEVQGHGRLWFGVLGAGTPTKEKTVALVIG